MSRARNTPSIVSALYLLFQGANSKGEDDESLGKISNCPRRVQVVLLIAAGYRVQMPLDAIAKILPDDYYPLAKELYKILDAGSNNESWRFHATEDLIYWATEMLWDNPNPGYTSISTEFCDTCTKKIQMTLFVTVCYKTGVPLEAISKLATNDHRQFVTETYAKLGESLSAEQEIGWATNQLRRTTLAGCMQCPDGFRA